MSNTNIEGIQTIVGDVIISKDGNGDLGNLTVQGTLFCESISAESLPGTVYTTTLTGDGHTSTFNITHNLQALSPSTTITDENGNVCIVDVAYPSANSIRIIFPNPVEEGETFNISIRK